MTGEMPWRVEGGDEPEAQEKPKDALLRQARENWLEFSRVFGKTIGAYFGTPDMTFTADPGGWYIDLEKIRVNADPSFFIDRGYTQSEAIFATFHEAEHFRDMIEDPDLYTRLFERLKSRTDVHGGYPKALQRLYNCLDDILVNRAVMSRWKAGRTAKDSLYPKLFQSRDFRGQPRHRQLMYALLREAMLPQEAALVDDEVRSAMDSLESRFGKQLSRLLQVDRLGKARQATLGDASFHRFGMIESMIEPIFEQMYKQDLEDRRERPKPPKPGEGEGEGDGDPFGDDPLKNAIPDPLDFDDAAKQAKELNRRINEAKKDKFKELMGVDQKDFEAYRRDLDQVKEHIEALSRVFDAVIQKRKSYRRVLRRSVKEGPLLDPRKAATGVAEIKAGHMDPRVMLDYETKEVVRNRPNRFEFTLVCDGSGSMDIDAAKKRTQRLVAVLATEALAEFNRRLEAQRQRGEKMDLQVFSELRMFSDNDEVIKPLSTSLTHQERVRLHRRLKNLPSGSNNEPATFEAIEREQFGSAQNAALQSGDTKKVVLFLTDGDTDEAAVQAHIERLQAAVRDPMTGKSNLVIAGIGFADGIGAVQTYRPEGYYAKELAELPDIFSKFLANVLEDV